MHPSLCEACGKSFDSKPSYRKHKRAIHTRIVPKKGSGSGIGLQSAKQPLSSSSSSPQESQGENCEQEEKKGNESDSTECTNPLGALLDACNVPEQTCLRSGSELYEDWEVVDMIQGDELDDHTPSKGVEIFMDDIGWGYVGKIARGWNIY